MPDDRETIMSAIKAALEPLPERAAYPEWDPREAVCREHPPFDTDWDLFAHKTAQVNGTALPDIESLAEWLLEKGAAHGYCDPALAEALVKRGPFRIAGEATATGDFDGIVLETELKRETIDNYSFGITRATGAIAETGSVVLSDRDVPTRLGALAPWVHIALLRPEDLWPDTMTAISKLGDDPNVIWATGPSKTADVEGILIEGVHGPGEQVTVLIQGEDAAALG